MRLYLLNYYLLPSFHWLFSVLLHFSYYRRKVQKKLWLKCLQGLPLLAQTKQCYLQLKFVNEIPEIDGFCLRELKVSTRFGHHTCPKAHLADRNCSIYWDLFRKREEGTHKHVEQIPWPGHASFIWIHNELFGNS